jgi:hypothetical protein
MTRLELPMSARANHEAEKAARIGEVRFQEIGGASCHVPNLPLTKRRQQLLQVDSFLLPLLEKYSVIYSPGVLVVVGSFG